MVKSHKKYLITGGCGFVGLTVIHQLLKNVPDVSIRIMDNMSGDSLSVREVIAIAGKITGRGIHAIESKRRPGDPAVLVGSSDKIRKILGWQPVHGRLNEIIQTGWNWHQKRFV